MSPTTPHRYSQRLRVVVAQVMLAFRLVGYVAVNAVASEGSWRVTLASLSFQIKQFYVNFW